jgi:hypothetical protein
MSFGKFVVTFELTREEAQKLQEKLGKTRWVGFRGESIHVTEVEEGDIEFGVQRLLLKGTA